MTKNLEQVFANLGCFEKVTVWYLILRVVFLWNSHKSATLHHKSQLPLSDSFTYLRNIVICISGGFARVASTKMMSDCHMLRMNVCDAGTQRHEKRVDIYKSASVACERFTRTRQTVCDPDRQAGRQVGTRKRVDIYKSGGYDL